jgi:hypothetical protein
MSNTMNSESREQKLTTADLAASANQQLPPRKEVGAARQEPATPRPDADLQADASPQDDNPRPDDRPPQNRTPPGATSKARGPATGDREPSTKSETKTDERDLASLFAEDVAAEFRTQWDVVQRGFVDDPRQSVRAGDELVAQVIKSLAETFSGQRASLEGAQADQASTENLRLALRRYRSFFERLLSI